MRTERPAPPALRPVGAHVGALDGIRTVAILLVVGTHTAAVTGVGGSEPILWRMVGNGGVGVSVFFVLSGFLLYRPWARAALDGTERPSARAYLRRRAFRILPAYWLMLLAVLPLFHLGRAGSPGTWLEFLTLTHTFHWDPWWQGAGPQALGPVWSLSVEAAFYVTLPLLARLLHRFARGSRARLLAGIGVLGGASLALTTAVRYSENIPLLFYNEHLLPRSLMIFACGMALAVLAERPGRLTAAVGAAPGVGWVVAICSLALVSTPIATPASGPQNADQYLVNILLFPLIAVAVVAPAAFAPHGPFTAALLANPVMRQLGLISFGVFLWHSPLMEGWYELTGRPFFQGDFWTVLTVTLFSSLIVAVISYLLVEAPAQRFARRRRPEPVPAGAASTPA